MANQREFMCTRKCRYPTVFQKLREGQWCCTKCGSIYLIDPDRSSKGAGRDGSGMGMWNGAQLGPPKRRI